MASSLPITLNVYALWLSSTAFIRISFAKLETAHLSPDPVLPPFVFNMPRRIRSAARPQDLDDYVDRLRQEAAHPPLKKRR